MVDGWIFREDELRSQTNTILWRDTMVPAIAHDLPVNDEDSCCAEAELIVFMRGWVCKERWDA